MDLSGVGLPKFKKSFGRKDNRVIKRASGDWDENFHVSSLDGKALIIKPKFDGVSLFQWANNHKEKVLELLKENHGILFRGFNIHTTEEFKDFVLASSNGELMEYKDRTTPRTTEGKKIYTSTVYPPDQRINLHNEGTYWEKWPLKLYLYCQKSPSKGGETPLSNVQKVYEEIPENILQKFKETGVMLVRNYHKGLGLPWQEVFQTDSEDEFEAYCKSHNIAWEWKGNGTLKTSQVRPAIRKNPLTGKNCWFNHGIFFNELFLEPTLRKMFLKDFGREGLPYNTYYGDGQPIEPEVFEIIRSLYEKHQFMFPWKENDVALIDNMALAHAREPFEGERKVIVAMADPFKEEDLN